MKAVKSEGFKEILKHVDSEDLEMIPVILRNLWDEYKYTQEYLQYFQGAVSEEELNDLQYNYASPFLDIPSDKIRRLHGLCRRLLGRDLDVVETATLIGAAPPDVMNAFEEQKKD